MIDTVVRVACLALLLSLTSVAEGTEAESSPLLERMALDQTTPARVLARAGPDVRPVLRAPTAQERALLDRLAEAHRVDQVDGIAEGLTSAHWLKIVSLQGLAFGRVADGTERTLWPLECARLCDTRSLQRVLPMLVVLCERATERKPDDFVGSVAWHAATVIRCCAVSAATSEAASRFVIRLLELAEKFPHSEIDTHIAEAFEAHPDLLDDQKHFRQVTLSLVHARLASGLSRSALLRLAPLLQDQDMDSVLLASYRAGNVAHGRYVANSREVDRKALVAIALQGRSSPETVVAVLAANVTADHLEALGAALLRVNALEDALVFDAIASIEKCPNRLAASDSLRGLVSTWRDKSAWDRHSAALAALYRIDPSARKRAFSRLAKLQGRGQSSVLRALMMAGERRVMPAIVRVVRDHTAVYARSAALDSVGMVIREWDDPALLKTLSQAWTVKAGVAELEVGLDRERPYWHQVVRALQKATGPRCRAQAEQMCLRMLDQVGVRGHKGEALLEALGRIGGAGAAATLAKHSQFGDEPADDSATPIRIAARVGQGLLDRGP